MIEINNQLISQNYNEKTVLKGILRYDKGYIGIVFNITLDPSISGGIEYCTHVQDIGWQSYVANNAMSGTESKCLRLEGIEISS